MNKKVLIAMGFKELPHFNVGGSLIYDLGRNRHLSAVCIDTPNEALFVCATDPINPKNITDAVCIHNWDYDGYLTAERIRNIMNGFNPEKI